MGSWLFSITDNATDSVYVLGAGATVEDAEADATAKWHYALSDRADYEDRIPVSICCATVSTNAEPGALPSLII